MDDSYFYPVAGKVWTTSRWIAGRSVCLVQNSRMERESDIVLILQTLAIPATPDNLDLYFPHRGNRGRCPTLALLELFSLDGQGLRDKSKEVGV